jgi:hypothetical protein
MATRSMRLVKPVGWSLAYFALMLEEGTPHCGELRIDKLGLRESMRQSFEMEFL